MEEPLPIFQSRFSECLKHIEIESRKSRENIRIIAAGQGRTVHFNNLSECIRTIQQILDSMKKMSLRDDVIREEVNRRVSKIIDNAAFLAKKELDEIDKVDNVDNDVDDVSRGDMTRNGV